MNRTLAALALVVAAAPALADDYSTAMQAYLDNSIRGWAADPVLIAATRARNAVTAGLSQSDIDTMDLAWRAEVGTAATPTITPILNNPAADFLRHQVEVAGGAITEAFIMDDRGLLVAASAVTSDYWQGDEAKWSETYPKGAAAVHMGEVEFDEFSQTYQGQVSIPLVDAASGEVVGALTVGLNADAL